MPDHTRNDVAIIVRMPHTLREAIARSAADVGSSTASLMRLLAREHLSGKTEGNR